MDVQALAAWLYENLPGEYVKPVGDKISGWRPEPGRCHENVARWLEDHPDHTAVRGWLDVSFLAPTNRRRFGSHSIVATATGELLDITLSASDGRYGFIRHPGSEADFLGKVASKHLATIDHLLEPDTAYPVMLASDEEWPPPAI